jgi:hypothetical protein
MHLVLPQTSTHSLGDRTHFAGTDQAMSHSQLVGFDTITGVYSRKTTVTIDVALGLKGGIITLRVSEGGQSTKFRGRVLGGTGTYAGARGTVRGHSPSQNSKKTFVTLNLR